MHLAIQATTKIIKNKNKNKKQIREPQEKELF
jgi:hypothetical protein